MLQHFTHKGASRNYYVGKDGSAEGTKKCVLLFVLFYYLFHLISESGSYYDVQFARGAEEDEDKETTSHFSHPSEAFQIH